MLPEDELLREFVGDPRERLRSWFDPDAPADDRRRPEPGQLHEGPHRPARLLRPPARRAGRRVRRVGEADRPPLRRRAAVPLRGRGRDRRRHGHDRRHGDGRRRPPPRPGPAGRLRRASPASGRSRPTRCAAAIGNARAVAVIERTDEPAAARQPAHPRGQGGAVRPRGGGRRWSRACGRCPPGLGSRDVGPGDLLAVFDWLADHRAPGRAALRDARGSAIRWPSRAGRSTCGRPAPSACAATRSAASDRSRPTSSSPRSSATCSACYVQAYPRYGSEKKGLPTTYYLTLATERIRQHGELEHVDFVPLHDVAAFRQGDPLRGLADGGTVFVQSPLTRSVGDLGLDPVRGPPVDARPAASGSPPSTPRRSPATHAPAPGPRPAAAGHRPRRRVPAPDAVRGAGRAGPRRAAGGRAARASSGSSASAAAASSTPTSR